jgi:hypothetical protein
MAMKDDELVRFAAFAPGNMRVTEEGLELAEAMQLNTVTSGGCKEDSNEKDS